MRYIFILLLSSLLTACGEAEMSNMARGFLLVFFIMLLGLYFISPKIPVVLEKLHITELILRNANKIIKILYYIGFPLALFSAIRMIYIEYGRADMFNIQLIIFSITILLLACCIKKFEQTNDKLWLRRSVHTIYIGILCITGIIIAPTMIS